MRYLHTRLRSLYATPISGKVALPKVAAGVQLQQRSMLKFGSIRDSSECVETCSVIQSRSIRCSASSSIDSKSTTIDEVVELTPSPALSYAGKIRLLYDGDCPLCMKEVDFLMDRNKKYDSLYFVDIASEDYKPEDNEGIEWETAMSKIHAIMPDGTIVTGIETFRRLYEAVGLGWVYKVTSIPAVSRLADRVYDFWAEHRLPITGRPALAVVMEARRQKLGDAPVCGLDGKCH